MKKQNTNRTEMIAMQQAGGIIETDSELLSIDLNTDNDNDPLPENQTTFPNIDCLNEDWDYTDICYRKQIVSTKTMPS